jgi:hypothetical protein
VFSSPQNENSLYFSKFKGWYGGVVKRVRLKIASFGFKGSNPFASTLNVQLCQFIFLHICVEDLMQITIVEMVKWGKKEDYNHG